MSKEKEDSVMLAKLKRATRDVEEHREATAFLLSSGPACGMPEVLRWNGTTNSVMGAKAILVDALDAMFEGDWSAVAAEVKLVLKEREEELTKKLCNVTSEYVAAGSYPPNNSK